VAGLSAINAVLKLSRDPRAGKPHLRNRYGGPVSHGHQTDRVRAVAELSDAGVRMPTIATAGIRTCGDCRAFFSARVGAPTVGSGVWPAPRWGYLFGPLRGLGIRLPIRRVERLDSSLTRPLLVAARLPVDSAGSCGEVRTNEAVAVGERL
jgi:hypothetical protein